MKYAACILLLCACSARDAQKALSEYQFYAFPCSTETAIVGVNSEVVAVQGTACVRIDLRGPGQRLLWTREMGQGRHEAWRLRIFDGHIDIEPWTWEQARGVLKALPPAQGAAGHADSQIQRIPIPPGAHGRL